MGDSQGKVVTVHGAGIGYYPKKSTKEYEANRMKSQERINENQGIIVIGDMPKDYQQAGESLNKDNVRENFTDEESSGLLPYPRWLIEGFNDVLQETGLIDMDIVGHQFTWEMGVGTEDYMEIRLDRGLSNNLCYQFSNRHELLNLRRKAINRAPRLGLRKMSGLLESLSLWKTLFQSKLPRL
ncbi:hypothetical protein POM88_054866 [Heracleum sosnowskyi]|uniref:Uncharacterized protein n=1 Tax=Heracleum sosnowskyi TaxID=360622 RepID=A0AAD8GM71_9APIA|nr:hypothetical protein POM88_054866 [Heracleum sosnowskyi]